MTDSQETDAGDNLHYDPEEETVTDAWKGVFIYTSWGYGQTNTELARIIDVSDTGKTVVAQMVTAERVSADRGSESLRPSAQTYGDKFRLHVRNGGDGPLFRGSYPYINGDKEKGTRRDTFLVFSNEEGKTVHQTPPNQGH